MLEGNDSADVTHIVLSVNPSKPVTFYLSQKLILDGLSGQAHQHPDWDIERKVIDSVGGHGRKILQRLPADSEIRLTGDKLQCRVKTSIEPDDLYAYFDLLANMADVIESSVPV